MNVQLKVESGAGNGAMISDDEYINAGATITTKEDILKQQSDCAN